MQGEREVDVQVNAAVSFEIEGLSREARGLIAHCVCLSLLLQTAGLAKAVPLVPEQQFVTPSELSEPPAMNPSDPEAAAGFRAQSEDWWETIEEAARSVSGQMASVWADRSRATTTAAAGIRIARLGGSMPLPSRLMAVLFGAQHAPQSGPPSPPRPKAEGSREPVTEAQLAVLRTKLASEQIALVPGFNLVSLPEAPADTSPAAVSSAIGGQFRLIEAYDACDPADPWKTYDPADPARSTLTAIDHRIGWWVDATTATALPSDGTLPASTTIDLCPGWNLIGFPAGVARHPLVALSSIAGKWQRLFGYDAFDSADPWEIFDPAVPAWANDLALMQPGRGYWLLVTEATTLEIRNEGPPPTVAISAPSDLAVVTEPTEILGTVASDRLASWSLTYRAIGDGQAVPIATGNTPISGASFGTFDPTLLLNGLYELELTAKDIQGQQVTESIALAVEGQMKIGHFTLSFVDLAIPVSGLDIEVVRTYDSRDKRQGDFGVGWSLDIRQGSYRNNRPPGDGWQLQTGFLPCDTVLESKSHLTVVRLSEQEVYRFALRLENGVPSAAGGCFADARFDFVDGPLPGSTLDIIGGTQVFWANGSDEVVDVDTLALFQPEDVRLTTRDGRVFELDLSAGVTRVEDPNGNRLDITPAGITHSSGRGIAFERDAEGRIIRITDPLDWVNGYAYDGNGDLVAFTDRAGNTTRFSYDDQHKLLDIEDPRGIKPLRNEYDAEGRLVRHIDAFGKVIELAHDLANRKEVVTNRLGASRVLEYEARGNVIRETDELGKVTTRVFDERDNLLSETDPLGRVTTFTYTADGDLATQTDALGATTSFTYNARGQLLTVTDPRGAATSNVLDSRDNLIQTTDRLGRATAFTYDASGNLLTATDALGHLTRFEYDAFGYQTKEIDPLGSETLATYDAAGNRLSETRTRTLPDGSIEELPTSFDYDSLDRVTSTTAPDGSVTATSYGLLGQVASRTDALGRVTTMTYDLLGRLVTTSYPDGTAESQDYDAEGRLVGQVDRGGRTTTFTYDSVGRQVSTRFPDGATISSAYDAAGQLITSTDARGNTTSFLYDAAGRRTAVIDPLGNGSTFTYDAVGHQTAVTDAKGQATAFAYDAAGQLTATTFPDGTRAVVTFDALGRSSAETDQAGLTTEFAYDPLGRLISVKDALDQVTRYTYDEVGNRLTQTDANGHTTRFEYDRMGRQTARVFPDGARETLSYHADGTVASHTDFGGATKTFEYDANRRLIRRAYPDTSEVAFSYTATGRRASVTDARGTTTYAYDRRDRLTEKTDPTGHKLEQTYDLEGNRTSLTATVGAASFTSIYTYDALDRLASVTDSQGGVTSLAYDENGNRASLVFPNSVRTAYTYDALDRLRALATTTSVGEVLQSYAYTLGPAGNRTRIEEHDGTSRHYTYDALYRLTQDRVSDLSAAQVYQRNFSYDPVGNRLGQTIDEGSEPTVITSTYDARDRLLTTASTSHSWDTNGNLISQEGTSYEWDFDSRLTSVTSDGGASVETTYDANGNRVRTAITLPGGPTTTVDYLVDTTGFLSHVVAEVVNGSVETLYTRADDQLIGLYRPASDTLRYYHADGLGSIRGLSDQAGELTDRYSYTAFGELLEHVGSDPNTYRFAAEPLDPNSGFYYNRARWLDVANGRFVSVDPFQGLREDPASLHTYSYAKADPVGQVDPSGLFSVPESIANLAAAAEIRIASLSLQVGAAFAAGGGAIWRVWSAMGRYAENVARSIVIQYGEVSIRAGTKIVRRIPDFFLQAPNGLRAWLEVKWNLPWTAGPALTRLVGQVTEAWSTRQGQVVVWSLREPTLRQLRLVQDRLGSLATRTQFVHGVEGLYRWLRFYFG